jgi:hypothetical protein
VQLSGGEPAAASIESDLDHLAAEAGQQRGGLSATIRPSDTIGAVTQLLGLVEVGVVNRIVI